MAQADVLLPITYQSQHDNQSRRGIRECFSTTCAMLASHYVGPLPDDRYNRIREGYGDTTVVSAQLSALRALGLRPRFQTDGSRETVEALIMRGEPVAVGWLHRGHVTRPSGGGHWGLICGLWHRGLILHDPWGEPDLVHGGFVRGATGRAVRCTWRNFLPRWEADGPDTGWLIRIAYQGSGIGTGAVGAPTGPGGIR
jgi:hypothetical protein